eukprot:gene9412-19529_t
MQKCKWEVSLQRPWTTNRETEDELVKLKLVLTHMCEYLNRCSSLSKELAIISNNKIVGHAFGKWWQNYWEPTWSCPLEERLMIVPSSDVNITAGGDGGKWVCDPPYIRKNCLVYSFGSNGDYSFELGVHASIGCEIHVFDPFTKGSPPDNMTTNIFVHDWGLSSVDTTTPPLEGWGNTTKELKSLSSIIALLGHTGRAIDILKIDIDGVEFGLLDRPEFWDSLISSDGRGGHYYQIEQLLIELHFQGIDTETFKFRDKKRRKVSFRTGPEMDLMLRSITNRGFVMFHKEVNLIGSPPNDACEFSFLRLNITCEDDIERERDRDSSSYTLYNSRSSLNNRHISHGHYKNNLNKNIYSKLRKNVQTFE